MNEIKNMFKDYLLSDPLDVYRADDDLKVSTLELVEERVVDEESTREIGSANLFLASAFLSTVNGIDLPARSDEDLKKSQDLWETMVAELKSEGFIREKPTSVRERFTLV